MTQDEWRAIVKAWAAWVNGEGPPVQGRLNDTQWVSWEQSGSIRSDQFPEWRIKPLPKVARMLQTASGIQVLTKLLGAPSPMPLDGEQWIGDWHEIPEG